MHKITVILVAVLASAFCMQPAYAQNTDKALFSTLKRKLTEAQKASRQKNPVCVYCGEEITHEGQHCTAKACTGLCSATKESRKTEPAADAPAAVCPKCGQAYTIDERYHGQEHICSTVNAKNSQPVCVYCGEEITHEGQHCTAKACTGLCSATKESRKAEPAADAPAAVCPKCGPYTIDERYHGEEHICSTKDAKKSQPVCVYCGEKITHEGQHCTAKACTGLCSATKESRKAEPAADAPAAVCPKCGQAYTIDERYHGQEHICPTK